VQPESATWVYFQKGRRERGERERKGGREGVSEGRRRSQASQATNQRLTLQVIPKFQLSIKGRKFTKTKTIIQLQNQNKQISQLNYTFKSHF
jgi:hypothetical protein